MLKNSGSEFGRTTCSDRTFAKYRAFLIRPMINPVGTRKALILRFDRKMRQSLSDYDKRRDQANYILDRQMRQSTDF